ncbi:hypothetical protein EAH89_08620 [Roseomonas nepalensis]|uniref:DUF927 domain-containing protein n=1 Tax=Muricoccus nepalensis TaxID=1854500 RepID=A0A502G7D3_9PROT|nr:hypothetical protein [Roseomonas nepalensis]TPG58027.1 hypothetical protein EAH89_08620 [Roseomonas nepalensis]
MSTPFSKSSPIRCTFGHHTQTGPWTHRREVTWGDLAVLLTGHELGQKEGTCWVPATFRGTSRKKEDAERIEVAVLDCDAGHDLDQISASLAAHGWAATIASTHSHGTSCTKVKREDWVRFRSTAAAPELAAAALLIAKGYLPQVADGAKVVWEDATHVLIEHQPCPKFRVIVPLLTPWQAADYPSQAAANAAWKERIVALAAALGLDHDQACTDTSRLFYLPRRPAEGPAAECAVLEGVPCDLFNLPAASPIKGMKACSPQNSQFGGRVPANDDALIFADPTTGEVVDLLSWARSHAARFEIATALATRRPDLLTGKVADRVKHHVCCANEQAHTQAGADDATFVVNAGESTSRGFVYHCRHAHCDGRDRLLFLRQMLEQGWLCIDDLTDPAFLAPDVAGRPQIRSEGAEIASIVDQAEDALLAANVGLFQRGPYIVRTGTILVQVPHDGDAVVRQILLVGDHALAEVMTRAADWKKFDGRAKQWVPIDAPLNVATTYRQRQGGWRLPVLAGLINAPTLRADGSVLVKPGYDAATGLLLSMDGVSYPEVPVTPDWEDGHAAISVLLHLIEGFPFVTDADHSVALAAILTACIRSSLPTAPLFAFAAPVAGSGKSKLVDLTSVIASGRAASVVTQGKNEEETEKRIGALLLAGVGLIAIDNCEAPLGGEFLCAALTQQMVRTRILGRSEVPELPTNVLLTATGNNLTLVGDMTRRTIMARLDPGCERPELRTFNRDPIAEVKADRPRYVIAALTALRAFFVAGQPQQRPPLGSFAEWSRTVRDAIIWYKLADPVETMEALRHDDPKLDALLGVVTQWAEVIGDARVSVREIIEAATAQVPTGGGTAGLGRPAFRCPEFREALLAVAGEGGAINSRRLGKWLSLHKGRIVDGYRICRLNHSGGTLYWQLEEVVAQHAAA